MILEWLSTHTLFRGVYRAFWWLERSVKRSWTEVFVIACWAVRSAVIYVGFRSGLLEVEYCSAALWCVLAKVHRDMLYLRTYIADLNPTTPTFSLWRLRVVGYKRSVAGCKSEFTNLLVRRISGKYCPPHRFWSPRKRYNIWVMERLR